jgi:hypothetical protein
MEHNKPIKYGTTFPKLLTLAVMSLKYRNRRHCFFWFWESFPCVDETGRNKKNSPKWIVKRTAAWGSALIQTPPGGGGL